MKKTTFLAAASSFLVPTMLIAGTAFDGPYAGGTIGFGTGTFKALDTSVSSWNTTTRVYKGKDYTQSGFVGYANAGYGKVMPNNIYFGGNVKIGYDATKVKEGSSEVAKDFYNFETKGNMEFGARIVGGYLVSPKAVGYLGADLSFGKRTVTIKDNTTKKSADFEKSAMKYGPTVGALISVHDRVMVDLQYTFKIHPKHPINDAGVSGVKTDAEYKEHVFMVGAYYRFPMGE